MSEPFKIVKPNNNGSGTTFQFYLTVEKRTENKDKPTRCVFLNAANQREGTKIEDARFDYENKVVMKLGYLDIGKLLKVLDGNSKEEDIIHKFNKNGTNSTTKIKFSEADKTKYTGFYMRVGKKEGDISIDMGAGISDEEAICLKLLLEDAICKMYWGEGD